MISRKVYQIAERTRKWAEQINKQLEYMYDNDLCGMCAIASAELFLRLQRQGIDAVIVANNRHCFVLVDGYAIVDITATQFDIMDVVHIDHIGLNVKGSPDTTNNWWKAEHTFDNLDAFLQWQYKTGWPAWQQANVDLFEALNK